MDGSGRLFVGDQFNNTMRLLTPPAPTDRHHHRGRSSRRTLRRHRNAHPTSLSITVDSSNNVYVADSFNAAIRK